MRGDSFFSIAVNILKPLDLLIFVIPILVTDKIYSPLFILKFWSQYMVIMHDFSLLNWSSFRWCSLFDERGKLEHSLNLHCLSFYINGSLLPLNCLQDSTCSFYQDSAYDCFKVVMILISLIHKDPAVLVY